MNLVSWLILINFFYCSASVVNTDRNRFYRDVPLLTHKYFPKQIHHFDNNNNEDNELPKLTHDSTFNVQSKLKIRNEKEISLWMNEADRPIRHRIEGILDGKLDYCKRSAKCVNLTYNSCMGTKLPYASTTLNLTDLTTQDQIQETLWLYQHLRHVPKCWAVIQPFLCSLYMPKCENNMVDLPSMDMCNITRGPCKILYGTQFFPPLLRCENDKRMPLPRACKNDLREIKFNTTGQCLEPLIQTDSPASFYRGVDGCGLQCDNPLYSEVEHIKMHQLIAWGASICLFFNLFTIFTFMIDWKTANRYPGVEIFYINFCYFFSCIGWLAQFNFRDEIVCRKDGTLRMSEPSAGENLWCVVIFILVYYFLIAAMVWFVIFTYAWHLSVTVQALGKIPERIDKKGAYFHLASWSLPLVLTITSMALGEIDANSVTGICFVGYLNTTARAVLLLVPVCVALLIGYYFLFRGLLTLIQLELGSRDVISARASSEIRSSIIRVSIIYGATLFLGLATISYHVYVFNNSQLWRSSLHDLIICRITNHVSDYCELATRPDLKWLKLQLIAVFLAGIGMSSLVWTRPTLKAWIRFIRKKFDCEKEEPVRLQKHKVIAKAFAKRQMFYNAGRLSLSFHNTHTDPVGLDFDLASVASHDLSSTWAAALPKLMNRRCALTGAPTGSVSSQRRNSMDSEVSFSVRRVSVESRRNSVDSQLSVQVSELKATRKVSAARNRHRSNRNSRRRHRRTSRTSATAAATNGPLFPRRESSTSLESQLGAHLLNALVHPDVQSFVPNLKRRSANAGLDSQQITNLLTSGKLLLPLVTPSQPIGGASEVDEENNKSDQNNIDDEKTRNQPMDDEVLSDDSSQSSSGECAELTRLVAVQSSLNSGVSVGTQHGGCKSIDVGVQADLETDQMYNNFISTDELHQSGNTNVAKSVVSQGTQMSPMTNRRDKDSVDKNSPYTKKYYFDSKNKNNSGEYDSGLCSDKRYDKTLLSDDKEEHEVLIETNRVKIVR